MNPRTDILPQPQREFWETIARAVPRYFVLYGGTAIALRFGHRQSIDFDFFTDRRFEFDDLSRAMPAIAKAAVLQRSENTLVASLHMPSGEVKLSFFGGLSFGRVGDPDKQSHRPAIASPVDLLATKLKTLHDRIEAKDYVDIEVLLRSGLLPQPRYRRCAKPLRSISQRPRHGESSRVVQGWRSRTRAAARHSAIPRRRFCQVQSSSFPTGDKVSCARARPAAQAG